MISVFWFITVLFLTQQIFNFLVLYVRNIGLFKLIIFCSLIFSFINSIFFHDFWIPQNANVVLAALPFYSLGYYDKLYSIRNKTTILFIASLMVVLPYLISFQNFSYDFKYAQYGIPFLTFYSSSVIVLIIKRMSGLISKQKTLCYLFTKLGQSSMVIMYLHMPIKDLFNRLGLSNSLNLVLSLLTSYLFYRLFTLHYITRALLIGSKNDFIDLQTNFNFLFKKKYVQ